MKMGILQGYLSGKIVYFDIESLEC